ncbi:hypothetical protein DERP_002613 [Dermatophagoides pteronyssinus]|uniref:Uncharacterized protein n=1 Tax=Dermatophagoides pteronyssinus TaxID=6956 RepID=A0ABQ8JIB0_DERPT|nr:hypothetical protein DERP_002613 [Dermatophagoides pteronyssinus]
MLDNHFERKSFVQLIISIDQYRYHIYSVLNVFVIHHKYKIPNNNQFFWIISLNLLKNLIDFDHPILVVHKDKILHHYYLGHHRYGCHKELIVADDEDDDDDEDLLYSSRLNSTIGLKCPVFSLKNVVCEISAAIINLDCSDIFDHRSIFDIFLIPSLFFNVQVLVIGALTIFPLESFNGFNLFNAFRSPVCSSSVAVVVTKRIVRTSKSFNVLVNADIGSAPLSIPNLITFIACLNLFCISN